MSDLINAISSPTLPITQAKVNAASGVKEIDRLREGAKEKKAFKEFEQMFVHLMLKEMRKTVNESSWGQKSHAAKMYEEMMDESLAAQMAESGQMGVARQLQQTLHADRLQQEIQVVEKSMMNGALERIKE